MTPSMTVTRSSRRSSLVHLAAADVERGHVRRAALQQAVGEAARRGADIEADEPGDVDAEGRQCRRELVAAARHELRPRSTSSSASAPIAVPALVTTRAVDAHAPGHHERLGAAAGLGEPRSQSS